MAQPLTGQWHLRLSYDMKPRNDNHGSFVSTYKAVPELMANEFAFLAVNRLVIVQEDNATENMMAVVAAVLDRVRPLGLSIPACLAIITVTDMDISSNCSTRSAGSSTINGCKIQHS